MKLNLFLLVCLTGIVQFILSFDEVPRLLLIKQLLTWSDARSYCGKFNGDLATVKNYSDLLKLRNITTLEGVTGAVWIGLYNGVNSWRFSLNDLPLTLSKWSPGEPDNWQAAESCVILKPSGVWGDTSCTSLRPFICYNAMLSGNSRYIGISSSSLEWTAAQTYCRTHYTDLASVLAETENSILAQIASAQGSSWFGLYRDTWMWVDGTYASSLSWNNGQPNNYYGNEACGRFVNGLFDDERCSNLHYFFCHSYPPRRQIIKLQVKSDQSVFNPAVQSAILAKLYQKLKEHGMLQNVTVTWRVGSDGNIFKKINNS